MTSKTRNINAYGLVGDDIIGIKWFATPEACAEAMREHPLAKIRLNVDGRTTHGLAEEVAPIYDALRK